MPERVLLFTCEHGGTRIPARHRTLFAGAAAQAALRTHRGSDIGALPVARLLSVALSAPLHASQVSRLLVDLNRSPGHPKLFSEFSRGLSRVERDELMRSHYQPHRSAVESWIDEQVAAGREVVHVGVHSFAALLDGEPRRADLGLLYDPARSGERRLAARWRGELGDVAPGLRVRRNYPYLGRADGFTTYLRRRFGSRSYVGIELEINQAGLGSPAAQRRVGGVCAESLRRALPR